LRGFASRRLHCRSCSAAVTSDSGVVGSGGACAGRARRCTSQRIGELTELDLVRVVLRRVGPRSDPLSSFAGRRSAVCEALAQPRCHNPRVLDRLIPLQLSFAFRTRHR
jgi:hypothetical protein